MFSGDFILKWGGKAPLAPGSDAYNAVILCMQTQARHGHVQCRTSANCSCTCSTMKVHACMQAECHSWVCVLWNSGCLPCVLMIT